MTRRPAGTVVLAVHETEEDAQAAAMRWLQTSDGVRVEYAPRWPDDPRPWAIVAPRRRDPGRRTAHE